MYSVIHKLKLGRGLLINHASNKPTLMRASSKHAVTFVVIAVYGTAHTMLDERRK